MSSKEYYNGEQSFVDEVLLKDQTIYNAILSLLRMNGVDIGRSDSKFKMGKVVKKSEWVQLEITVVSVVGESRVYMLELRIYG